MEIEKVGPHALGDFFSAVAVYPSIHPITARASSKPWKEDIELLLSGNWFVNIHFMLIRFTNSLPPLRTLLYQISISDVGWSSHQGTAHTNMLPRGEVESGLTRSSHLQSQERVSVKLIVCPSWRRLSVDNLWLWGGRARCGRGDAAKQGRRQQPGQKEENVILWISLIVNKFNSVIESHELCKIMQKFWSSYKVDK